jgi:hypothetical protein
MTALRRILLGCLLLTPSVAALPVAPASAGSDAGFTLVAHRYPSGGPEGYGDATAFRLHDDDLSPELSAFSVRVSSSTDPVGVRVLTVREARASSSYSGALRFTAAAATGSAACCRWATATR